MKPLKKTYEIGEWVFVLEECSGSWWLRETLSGMNFEYLFRTKLEALEEILSYAEIEEWGNTL